MGGSGLHALNSIYITDTDRPGLDQAFSNFSGDTGGVNGRNSQRSMVKHEPDRWVCYDRISIL